MGSTGFATTGGITSHAFSQTRWGWYVPNAQCVDVYLILDPFYQGKTVQIVTFIGTIIKAFDAAPALVVVPNSTITNWSREFSSWAPGIRVVPFYGEAKSREVLNRYELKHPTKIQGTTGAKFHVLITTYDIITSKDFNTVIKNIPRWEVLVVDEGQRRKPDVIMLWLDFIDSFS
jgi:chromodomain-helicase-DNA-binding protein 4